MTRITVQDCKELGWCNAGLREFAKQCGFSWQAFLDGGIDSKELERVGDDINVQAIIKHVTEKENADVGR